MIYSERGIANVETLELWAFEICWNSCSVHISIWEFPTQVALNDR